MCPGMLLAVTVQLVLPLTKPVVYELDWDRADARVPFGLARISHTRKSVPNPLPRSRYLGLSSSHAPS